MRGRTGPQTQRARGAAPSVGSGGRRAVGPVPALHGVVRWRLVDLPQWVWEEFRIRISVQTLSRELWAIGDRNLSVRPRHYAQDADAMAAFKILALQAARGRNPKFSRQRYLAQVPG